MTLSDLYTHGISVFGDLETFSQWLERPNKALGGIKPIEADIQDVDDLLGRIEHGVIS